MTTLILAQKRFLSPHLTAGTNWLIDHFVEMNRNGIISLAVIAFAAAAAFGYIFSIYVIFEAGFSLQEQERTISQLETSLAASEVKANEFRARLAKDNAPLLDLMEKISDVKYIVEDGFAVSRPTGHP